MENKTTANFSLTAHAHQRLNQRSRVEYCEINGLLKRGIDLRRDGCGEVIGRLFWSHRDDRAYIAIYNMRTHEVITIFEAYDIHDDGSIRRRILKHEAGIECSREMYFKLRIRKYELRLLVHAMNLPQRPEFAATPAKSGAYASYTATIYAEDGFIYRARQFIPLALDDNGEYELSDLVRRIHQNIEFRGEWDNFVSVSIDVIESETSPKATIRRRAVLAIFARENYFFDKRDMREMLAIKPSEELDRSLQTCPA